MPYQNPDLNPVLKMERSTLFLCFSIAFANYFLTEAQNLVTDGVQIEEAVHSIFANNCVEDLGCFYTGPPFFHKTDRPNSLPPTDKPKVIFHLFTPSNKDHPYNQKVAVESLEKSPFDPRLETKILIHGFVTTVEKGDVRYKTKDEFLRVGRFNVFIVDWTKHNGMPYEQAVANTRVVGAVVAKLVHLLMKETGISPNSVHIIGHSLGAHTAGYAGKRIPNLGRITGLDPAGPYYQNDERDVRLDIKDAHLVDIIHTDGADLICSGLGISEPIGHLDFYPNGGDNQPGCGSFSKEDNKVTTAANFASKLAANPCDHSRSNDLFLESIDDRKCRFLAVHCSNYSDFKEGRCLPKDSAVSEMGLHVKRSRLQPPAKFYLKTNAESPFCNQASIREH